MIPLTVPLADIAERFGRFLTTHGLNFERFSAHLRLDILTPREAWALRRFAAISGGDGDRINDLKNALTIKQSIAPITASSTLTGTAVDMGDTDGPCFGLLVIGAVSGGTTVATGDVKYQESDTAAGTYADIAGATHATITGTSAKDPDFRRFMRSKRFIRGIATVAGTGPTLVLGVAVASAPKRV